MSDLKRQMQIFVNGAWKDAHHATANEFPEDCVRFAEPMRPEMPDPKKTFADHSHPAYSREQMVQAMIDAVELYRHTQPEATAPAPIPGLPFADLATPIKEFEARKAAALASSANALSAGDNEKAMQFLLDNEVDTIYLDDGRIIDVGGKYQGRLIEAILQSQKAGPCES